MLAENDFYIIADKKTYPTVEEFVNEIKHCYGDYYISEDYKDKINTVWIRYSPFVVNEYTGKGSYCLTEPHKRGAFECWEYQHN